MTQSRSIWHWSLAQVGLVVVIVLLTFGWLAALAVRLQTAASYHQSANNLRIVVMAWHCCYSDYDGFLPQASYDLNSGQPLLSWRVYLEPYVVNYADEDNSRLGGIPVEWRQPWDGTANLGLLKQMPATYRFPSNAEGAGMTHIWMPYSDSRSKVYAIGQDAKSFSWTLPDQDPFKGRPGGHHYRRMSNMFRLDGTDNTIMLLELKQSTPWTAPTGLRVEANLPLPVLESPRDDGTVCVAMVDASVRRLRTNASPEFWRALFTYNGSEAISATDLDNYQLPCPLREVWWSERKTGRPAPSQSAVLGGP